MGLASVKRCNAIARTSGFLCTAYKCRSYPRYCTNCKFGIAALAPSRTAALEREAPSMEHGNIASYVSLLLLGRILAKCEALNADPVFYRFGFFALGLLSHTYHLILNE